jgi:hypothetical protein
MVGGDCGSQFALVLSGKPAQRPEHGVELEGTQGLNVKRSERAKSLGGWDAE